MNRLLAAVLAIGFIAVCIFILIGRGTADAPLAQRDAQVQPSVPVAKANPSLLTITVVSGPSKKTWLTKAIDSFNRRHEEVDGPTVVVTPVWANSGEVLRDLQEGKSKPELWSPADESWLRQCNEWWRNQHNRDVFPAWKPLVHVPLVIAMWEPMAKALGYPNPIGWTDLATLSAEPQGWAKYGHPEWGRFTWGHCHPDSANGFQTLVCAIYAASGKTTGLTVDDLRNPEVHSRLAALEQSVEHFGVSSLWIDEFMHTRGPSYLSAAAQFENNVIEGNLNSGSKPFPLVAIYPKEGTIFNDNPIAVAEGEWMDAGRTTAAQRFIEYLLTAEQQAEAVKAGLRPATSTAAPGGPFTAANGVQETLPAIPTFDVPNEAILKRVRDLWFETKKPASVTLLLDTSGSMKGEPMEKAKEGAITFLDQMYAKDEVEIITFNDRITPMVDMAQVSQVRENARERLRGLFAGGGTHLYDVSDLALRRITSHRQKEPRRHYGIVLLTDGCDEGSTMSRHDLLDKLPRGDAPEVTKLFTIAYGTEIDKSFLRELANRSNARMYESTAKNVVQVYTELSSNF